MPTPEARVLMIEKALNCIGTAIADLTFATQQTIAALHVDHDACKAVDLANEKARVAKSKLEIALKRAQEAVAASKGSKV